MSSSRELTYVPTFGGWYSSVSWTLYDNGIFTFINKMAFYFFTNCFTMQFVAHIQLYILQYKACTVAIAFKFIRN